MTSKKRKFLSYILLMTPLLVVSCQRLASQPEIKDPIQKSSFIRPLENSKNQRQSDISQRENQVNKIRNQRQNKSLDQEIKSEQQDSPKKENIKSQEQKANESTLPTIAKKEENKETNKETNKNLNNVKPLDQADNNLVDKKITSNSETKSNDQNINQEKIVDQETSQKEENLNSKESQITNNILDYYNKSIDTTKFNLNSINRKVVGFNFAGLNSVKNQEIKSENIGWNQKFSTFKLEINDENIKQENENIFLGEKNTNAFVYNTQKLHNMQITNNISAKNRQFTYHNSNNIKNFYPLNYFAFKSPSYDDLENVAIYQRNIRFSSGTAILLNSKDGKAAFLTNSHVVHLLKGQTTFWELMNRKIQVRNQNFRSRLGSLTSFARYYDNGKIHTLDNSALIEIWLQKYILENSTRQVNNRLVANFIRESDINEYATNLYKKYFSLATNFDKKGQDVEIFYFDYQNFIKDVENLIDFYSKNKEKMFLVGNNTQGLNSKWHEQFSIFIDQFKKFEIFWNKISQFPPLEISNRSWDDQDVDYSTKVGLFYPEKLSAKNLFKGVFITKDPSDPKRLVPFFFATNGPGASGSGIYNLDGSLAFLNRSIVLNTNKPDIIYYDQFNLTSDLSSGVVLKTNKYDLVSEIKKHYLK
ncbi:Uncharacterised protein [Mesomycoplasma conjunctivae]|uniref:Lipoprotein n=1 Tax=Mesomycoplasma conjunctivae (strain ATCC 25834 / NCTC 10147 / HRC/581) TaxID=572263 RepID=C5J689_MESCH|nr:hypothetical protein [Mesomycoplasma conjunctivae]CAT04981.1 HYPOTHETICAL PROTEIN MCJ_002900 [Mesomycoplasma conjunctivae]VEU66359.1 Uncharacterised protein [Mesomycoplasma conjunctivae]